MASRESFLLLGQVERPKGPVAADPILVNDDRMMGEGRRIFRHDSFGDEAFWSDALLLHKVIAGAAHGGGGAGASPKAALTVGLKVDTGGPAEGSRREHGGGQGER